jgi:hypothetical protein
MVLINSGGVDFYLGGTLASSNFLSRLQNSPAWIAEMNKILITQPRKLF